MAKHVDPDDAVGTQVVIVANLAPRKIFKIESQGMILTSETPDGGIAMPPSGVSDVRIIP